MRSSAAVSLLLVTLTFASGAHAQAGADAAMAEQLFRDARALMTAGRYTEACPKLAESQRIDPGVGTLINLGECYEKQGKLASAWATYREAGPMARRLGQRDRARFADARATALAESFSSLILRIADSSAGLVITLDDRVVPEVAWQTAIPIDSGHHTVSATAPKHKAWRSAFDVDLSAPAAKVTVDIPVLEPLVEPAPLQLGPAPVTVEPPRGSDPRRLLGWIGLGLGGAALATGTVFGVLAKSKNDEADAHCSAVDCDPTGIERTDQAKTRATVSTIFFVSAGALLVAGVVLLVTAPKSTTALREVRTIASW